MHSKRLLCSFFLLTFSTLYLVLLQYSAMYLSIAEPDPRQEFGISPQRSGRVEGVREVTKTPERVGAAIRDAANEEGRSGSLLPERRPGYRRDDIGGGAAYADGCAENSTAQPLINCSNVDRIRIRRKLGHGVTKHVYLGMMDDLPVAVKMVTRNVLDVTTCVRQRGGRPGSGADAGKRDLCYVFPNMKLMKEILIMLQLRHRNVLRLLGYCVRSEQTESTSLQDHGVIAVYEYGQRFYVGALAARPLRERLQVALEMAELLHYLQHSPIGSIRVSDFKAAHFLLAGGHVKLVDLDDWTSQEPSCRDPRSGIRDHAGGSTNRSASGSFVGSPCNYGVRCLGGICAGYNARYNLDNMNRLLLTNLLSVDSDRELDTRIVLDLTSMQQDLNRVKISARSLISRLRNLLKHEMFSH